MSKDEMALIVFLYCLVILISSLKPYWPQIRSLTWAKTLAIQWQEPVNPGSRFVIAETKPVHVAKAAQKQINKPRKELMPPSAAITTAKKMPIKDEQTTKG
jgi:hypothetical protein